MKRFLMVCLAVSILLSSQTISAQITTSNSDSIASFLLDAVVVTATRTETPIKNVASSITVITGVEIERSGQTSVTEVLREMDGVDVVQSGGPGAPTSLFMRGAEADYTLFLIDGVEMNDPMSTGRGYSFQHLMADDIERIEILRGPQSTLYGSDAVSGVINVITKRGAGRPVLSASARGGALGTVHSQVGLRGGAAQYHYALDGAWFTNKGISTASEAAGNKEKDGYRNASISGRFGLSPTPQVAFNLMARYSDGKTDIDNGSGAGADDPNRATTSKQLFLRTEATLKLWSNRWVQTVGYGLTNHNRLDNNPVDANQTQASSSAFDSRIHKIDWQNTLYLHEWTTVVVGVESEQEQGSSESKGSFPSTFARQSARMTGVYLQNQFQYRDLFFAAIGVRADHHSRFSSKATYRIAPGMFFRQTGTRIKGTYGTGFKAPSLFQLFSSYGDPTLKAGTSKGWDVGLEQYGWKNRLSTGITYFNNAFDNMVGFDNSTFTYNNIFRAETQGVEWFGRVAPSPNTAVQIHYTFTDTEDKSTKMVLVRRPRHKGRIHANHSFGKLVDLNLEIRLVGRRKVNDFSSFPSARVTLDGYQIVNLAVTYRVLPRIQLFGRIDNLFDKNYQEVLGFGTPGISGFFGIRVR